jgi:hypothetical protein
MVPWRMYNSGVKNLGRSQELLQQLTEGVVISDVLAL